MGDYLIQQFMSLVNQIHNERELLIEQISLLEECLLNEDFIHKERISHGTRNDFYYKSDVDVVFVVYYNLKSGKPAYAMIDKKVFDDIFRGSRKKVALSERNAGDDKVVVSMNGTYIPICHLAVGFDNSKHECVDHMLSNILINISKFLRICTTAENNCNKRNRRNKSNSEFDYNSAMDFRENWWLIPLATMLRVISMDDAIELNRGLSDVIEEL